MELKRIVLLLNGYERATLRTILEEEIDRNGKEYEDTNVAVREIINQLMGKGRK